MKKQLWTMCLALLPLSVAGEQESTSALPSSVSAQTSSVSAASLRAAALRERLIVFNKLTLSEAYLKVGHHGDWDKDALFVLDAQAHIFTDNCLRGSKEFQIYSSKDRNSEVTAAIGRALAAGCKDPLILYLQASRERDVSRQHELRAQASEGLRQRQYPPVRQLWSAFNFALSYKGDPNAVNEPQCKKALSDIPSLVASVLADDQVPDCYLHVLLETWDDAARNIRHTNPALCRSFLERLSEIPSAKSKRPWFVDTIHGVTHIQMAWFHRGGDWASNVTEDGWKGFAENLRMARDELTRAWEAKKDQPSAAAHMTTVAMGDGGGDAKLWFERAISADPGCVTAYELYRTGLMPRWGGSIDKLLDLGLRCAASDRLDEGVYCVFFSCVNSAIMESDNAEHVWNDPRVWQGARKVFRAMIEHVPDADKPRVRMTMLSFAWRCNAMDDAADLWRQLGGNVDQKFIHPLTKGKVDVIRGDIQAYMAKQSTKSSESGK